MSRVRWLALLSCLLGLFALTVAACGDDEEEGGGGEGGGTTVSGSDLTIYSSLPLQGTSKEQSEAVIAGEKLALQEAGNKSGNVQPQVRVAGRLHGAEPGHRGRGADRDERP